MENKNVRDNLIKVVEFYSQDVSDEKIQALYSVLVNENKKWHNSVIYPAIKALSDEVYEKLVDHMRSLRDTDHMWLFDIYRNAPEMDENAEKEPKHEVTVEEFTAEDLSFIK
ncbi:MAG: hypothetical protein IJY90_02310 [Clostridia bacterium]|nr:hypothetical protein [Clostridia bacterium]